MADISVHATDHAQEMLQRRINTLRSKINTWYLVQQIYMPAASSVRSRLEKKVPEGSPLPHPYAMPLLLPSALDPKLPCESRLRQYEWELRIAQADDALDEIRDGLRLRSHLFFFKDHFERGIRRNTRSKGVIDKLNARIDTAATKYTVARLALQKLMKLLVKPPSSLSKFKVLAKEDIRGMSAAALGDSEGNRTVSWIWTVHGVAAAAGSNVQLHDCAPFPFGRSDPKSLIFTSSTSD
jgi:hypothetical protein